ncbi:MAG: hypothetical protein ACR2I5_02370 [Candidatus Limnocylindria bacterium]
MAAREGLDAGERSRHMGRLGRAVLYASFSLAVTVTSVMAASQAALPGEVLYPLKRQIEQFRVEVLPSRFHAGLAAYALSERIGEMDRLAAAGDWDGAARLATTIEAGYLELLAIDPAGTDAALHQHLVVLNRLLERLPESARSAIQTTIDRASEVRGAAPGSGSTGDGRGPGDRPDDDASSGGSLDRDASPTSTRSPKPEATPRADRPDPTPRADPPDPADPTRKPQPTPRAHDPASSDSTPKATKSPKPDGS